MMTTSATQDTKTSAGPGNNGRIRVLHICDKFGVDGSSIHGVSRLFSWWFPRFDKERFDVRLVGLRAPDAAGRYLESLGIPITYLGRSKFSPWTLPAVLAVMNKIKPDLLHLHGYGAGTFGRLAAAFRKLPVIVHEHFVDPAMPRYQIPVEKVLAPLASHTIAVACSVRDFCIEYRKLDPARVSVIYNGIPFDEFQPPGVARIAAARDGLRIPHEARIIGTVGRLHRQKGTEFLIRAMPAIRAKHPSVVLVIVGDGALRPDLERLCIRLGVCDNVIFAGFRNDVSTLLALFEVMVIPSLYEGTPLTVFEAMALARPIVASAVDGLKEVLVDGQTALLVPPGDPAALSERINTLLAEPTLQQQLSRGCERERTRFDVQATVDQIQEIYLNLVNAAK